MRLAFLGTPDFAATALAALLAAGHHVIQVYSQPARPAGRGQKLEPGPVARLALDRDLPLVTPAGLRDLDTQAAFRALDLDAAVVAAYGLILPRPILEAPRLGCFNIHASLLPRWRGAAPIQRAIMAGDVETGVTIMRMDAGLDTGPMLRRAPVTIGADMTGGALHDRLAALGAAEMVAALADLAAGRSRETLQPADGVTHAAKLTAADQVIDWTRPTREVLDRVRALAPRPGAHTGWDGARLKLLAAEPADGSGAPGEALDDSGRVATGDGALRLTRLQMPGRAAQPIDAFLRGSPMPRGTRLG